MSLKPADITLQQMGGANRLKSAIGAKDFYSSGEHNETLVFKFTARSQNSSNYIRITLNSMDTYDFEFIRIFNKKDKVLGVSFPDSNVISKHEGIYCDQLISLFEEQTGLYLTLK